MIEIRPLTRDEVASRLDDMAALRIAVFREWPYLYQGDLTYERAYLQPYLHSEGALVTGALDNGRLIGISTALPMEEQSADITDPLVRTGIGLRTVLYGGESVLLPLYRGRGIGSQFFDLREARARHLGRQTVTFCSVIRPDDHPLRPAHTRNNVGFWTRRGYAPVPGLIAEIDWRDRDQNADSRHQLQFWKRDLP